MSPGTGERVVALALVGWAIAGCGSEMTFPPAPKPPAPGEAVVDTEGSAAGPLRTPLFEIDPRDPAARPYFVETLARPSHPLASTTPQSLTAQSVIDTSRVEARDAAGELALFEAKIGEGERAALPLAPKGDECFTAIAHGGLGVMELDVFIVAGSDGDPKFLAEDEKSGPVAVAGGRAQCPPSQPSCGPVCVSEALESAPGLRVEVVVRRGRGPVVVGVARRPQAIVSAAAVASSPLPSSSSSAPAPSSARPPSRSPVPSRPAEPPPR